MELPAPRFSQKLWCDMGEWGILRPMRLGSYFLVLLLASFASIAGDARIIKVLPQLLDQDGREAINPSLFDRDAYQMHLRENPDLISALRFEVQYKTRGIDQPIVLRLEVRGSKTPLGSHRVFETHLRPGGWFAKWGQIRLDRATSESLGSLVAWRASLLQNDVIIAEQESFLW